MERGRITKDAYIFVRLPINTLIISISFFRSLNIFIRITFLLIALLILILVVISVRLLDPLILPYMQMQIVNTAPRLSRQRSRTLLLDHPDALLPVHSGLRLELLLELLHGDRGRPRALNHQM